MVTTAHTEQNLGRAIDWEALARANTHPLRVAIMEVLAMDGGRTLSPTDLSIELQTRLPTANYHVGELFKAGLLELVRTRQVRGAIEHFYRLPRKPKAADNRADGRAKRTAGLERASAGQPQAD